MNELKLFEFENKEVRTVLINKDVWFVASDVAKLLGYSKPGNAINQHCKHTLKQGIGVETGKRADGTPAIQQMQMNVINQGDVIRLIVGSQLPEAERIESWIFDEVIPTVLKTGMYMAKPLTFKETLKIALELEEKNELLQIENSAQKQIINEYTPKIDYVDTILKSKSLTKVTSIAKDYGMTATELNNLLHEQGIQYKQGDQWFLYKDYQNKGYTQSETVSITRADGRPDIKLNTKWTQKGRLFIHELLTGLEIKPNVEKLNEN